MNHYEKLRLGLELNERSLVLSSLKYFREEAKIWTGRLNTRNEVLFTCARQFLAEKNPSEFAKLIQKPVQESVQESIQESVQESVQKPVQESVQKPVQESIQEPVQEEQTPGWTISDPKAPIVLISDPKMMPAVSLNDRGVAESFLVIGLHRANRDFLVDGFRLLRNLKLTKQNPNAKTLQLYIAAQKYFDHKEQDVVTAYYTVDSWWRKTTGLTNSVSPVQRLMSRRTYC